MGYHAIEKMKSNLSPFAKYLSATGPWERILPPKLFASHLKRATGAEPKDSYWMMEAWSESLKHHGLTAPNPTVGCILLNAAGQEVSRGITQSFPGSHAEKSAFEKLTHLQELNGGTAYVTLEPCSHFGRNPPCADLLANSPLRRIVIARLDPNPLVRGQGVAKLRTAGKEVHLGTLSRELTAWHLGFLCQQILNRPLIALKWAQTLDGQLADDTMKSQWISGQTSRAYAHWLRQHYDLILVGAKTVLADCPRLDVRDCLNPHQGDPLPVVWDPQGLLFQLSTKEQEKLKSRTFPPHKKVVLITRDSIAKGSQQNWLTGLQNLSIVTSSESAQAHSVIQILSGPELGAILGRPIQSILIEGGAKTLSTFLSAGYGDIFHTFIAPIFTGGTKNRVSANKLLNEAQKMHMLASTQLEDDVVVELISQTIQSKLFDC